MHADGKPACAFVVLRDLYWLCLSHDYPTVAMPTLSGLGRIGINGYSSSTTRVLGSFSFQDLVYLPVLFAGASSSAVGPSMMPYAERSSANRTILLLGMNNCVLGVPGTVQSSV